MLTLRKSFMLVLSLWFTIAISGEIAGISDARASRQVLVSDLRIGQGAGHTRFVLNISEKIDFEVFTLADPYRIVIDFPEVAWRLDPAATQGLNGLIKGFRFGLYRPGRSRMVLDLTGPTVIANKFLLPPKGDRQYRLVLDLTATDRIGYLATAGWPQEPAETSAAEEEPPNRTTQSASLSSIPGTAASIRAPPAWTEHTRKTWFCPWPRHCATCSNAPASTKS
ncbi:MAG: AMIN domain-containing protein [Alphaproteobacteria bacterium]|nr:AMIN domain-containing protein [Alphaproteobacteria bacterium]